MSSRILQLAFTLWELAKHPNIQEKLRAEVNETLVKVKARGDAEFTANDFETMPYLVAVTKVCWKRLFLRLNEGETHSVLSKESLRVHPISVEVSRTPIQDDIMPLSKPVVGSSGKVYAELPVPKGTPISISMLGYNLYEPTIVSSTLRSYCRFRRNEGVWGPDALQFRPERWLEMNGEMESPVGVYGNLYGHTWSSNRDIGY